MQYSEFVESRKKHSDALIAALDDDDGDILHAALGIAGECGELIDAIKKGIVYDQDYDWDNIEEELGDMLFYMQILLNYRNLTIWDVQEMNVSKLMKRYPDGYSDHGAKARPDKENSHDDS